MRTGSYRENSVTRTDWTINGVNVRFGTTFVPDGIIAIGFINGSLVPVTAIGSNYLDLEQAPLPGDRVDLFYTTASIGYLITPGLTVETSDDVLTGDINGVNTVFTVTGTPAPWTFFALINELFVPCTQSGSDFTLTEIPLTGDKVTIAYTPEGEISAYWKSGYFGKDDPGQRKFFRYGKLVTGGGEFQVQCNMVDHDSNTLSAPEQTTIEAITGSKFAIGKKASMCAVDVYFPNEDANCEVLQLETVNIPRSER